MTKKSKTIITLVAILSLLLGLSIGRFIKIPTAFAQDSDNDGVINLFDKDDDDDGTPDSNETKLTELEDESSSEDINDDLNEDINDDDSNETEDSSDDSSEIEDDSNDENEVENEVENEIEIEED